MKKYKVVILDTQPIDPPVGGGRLRLLGLYSGFKNNIEATYVGTYDWRGPKYRDHMLSECLREINVPLSEEHFTAHDNLATKLGKGCIDSAFPLQGHLSEDFINKACEEAQKADIVIFSHQWLFPFVAKVLDSSRQLIVYDSHNCEGLLRVGLLDDGAETSDEICRAVVRSEYELCHGADLILACSEEDKDNFNRFYGIDKKKIIIVPNGVFTSKITPCSKDQKNKLREKLGITKQAVCFVGSDYAPNIEAGMLILEIAKLLPDYQFVIMGGVGERLRQYDNLNNVIITGLLDDVDKLNYLNACDIAINPMLAGSGVNIKMFDFMAAGLPIITTPVGARGIKNVDNKLYLLSNNSVSDLVDKIKTLLCNSILQEDIRQFGLFEVKKKYSWETISKDLGDYLVSLYEHNINNKKNKILMISTYPPEKCGIGSYALQQADFLLKQGNIVDVFALKGEGKYSGELSTPEQIEKLYDICEVYDKIILQYHAAFFYLNNTFYYTIRMHNAFRKLFKKNKNIEVVCHEIVFPLDRKNKGLKKICDIIENYFKGLKWKAIESVVFHSKRELDIFAKTLHLNNNRNKYSIVSPHHYYIKYTNVSKEEARSILGLGESEYIFLCIGFIQQHKAFDKVAEAFKSLQDYPNAKLYIVGSLRLVYDETLAYLDVLKSYSLQNSNVIIIENFLSDERFDMWITASDVVVIPYKEIWTSAILGRAKLYEKKCIIRDVGSLSEQKESIDYIFKDYNELTTILKDTMKRV